MNDILNHQAHTAGFIAFVVLIIMRKCEMCFSISTFHTFFYIVNFFSNTKKALNICKQNSSLSLFCAVYDGFMRVQRLRRSKNAQNFKVGGNAKKIDVLKGNNALHVCV